MARKKIVENKPVFFDTSGKRHKVVDFIVLILIAVVIVIATFTIYYLQYIVTIEHTAQSVHYRPPASETVLLYTEANTKGFGILGDRIQHIDQLLLPKYLVTEQGATTPISYTRYSQSLKTQSHNAATTYATYSILSTQDFSATPAERSYNNAVDARLTELIDQNEITNIVNNSVDAGEKGLYIALNLSQINTQESVKRNIALLDAFKKQLHNEDLKLGLILDPAELNAANASILGASDTVYFGQSKHTPAEQLAGISQHTTRGSGKYIFEIPTVSSKYDGRDTVQSTISVSFQSLIPFIKDKELPRSTQSIPIQDGTNLYSMYDAVSAYNYILSIDKLVGDANHAYAVADPGFEEYTIWKLLARDIQDKSAPHIVTDEVVAALDIKEHGQGQIYSLDRGAVAGKRTAQFGQDAAITSSTLIAADSPSVVTKQGRVPQKIALTFDDGPHPFYTPKIMDILEAHGVRGTFFVIGQNVINNPDAARAIVNRGHEIENHSYSHPVYSQLTSEANRSQLQATNDAIKTITGATAHYFRKPYSDHSQIANESDIEYLRLLDSLGLKASEYDIDSKDWLLDSSDEIVARVKSEIEASDGQYSQILLHDAHQDPELTIEALPKIIEYLRQQNIEIVLVRDLAATSASTDPAQTSLAYQALQIKTNLLAVFAWLCILFVLLSFTRYAWMFIGALFYKIKYSIVRFFVGNINLRRSHLPKLAIIISCYNEEKVVGKTIEALQQSTYHNFRLIIVNDGSKDKTATIVRKYAANDKRITLIDAPNGGKAIALERAMAATENRWLVFCDADTIFAPTALERFAMAALLDSQLGAIAGTILVGNDSNALTRSQVIEYGIAHKFIKAAQDVTNMITVVPGAAGMWHRPTLVSVGGFLPDTLAEDADATMRIIAKGSRVKYESTIAAYTEVPEKIAPLFKQRTRWQLGNMQSIFKHRKGLFNWRYGTLGFAGLPLFYLELISAIVYPFIFIYTALALALQGGAAIATAQAVIRTPSTNYAVFLGLVLLLVEVLLVVFVIITARKPLLAKLKLFLTIPYYMTVYKALLSGFTLVALMRAFRGEKQGWGHLTRTATAKAEV